jgi:hypothetical protein
MPPKLVPSFMDYIDVLFDSIFLSFKPSPHSVHGIYCSPADGNPILLTAGSDMKIRCSISKNILYLINGCALWFVKGITSLPCNSSYAVGS